MHTLQQHHVVTNVMEHALVKICTKSRQNQKYYHQQVLPKVIWEERVATPHGREWTRLLRVLLAAQYPLQINPITQPRVCYIHMSMSHMSYTLHCAVQFPTPKKKFPLPSWRQWNNGKQKLPIAPNSAYIQIPSPSKPILCICIFVPTSKKSLCQTSNIKLCNAHCRRVHGYATSTLQCHM